ncbi:hypothetical protein HYALB_00013441 [Hymenoscyphus albidus]|uniref:Large ribosomal subunit protein bL28m n=1 Tax=Hymenoscyphus albidus TaxID=595503 RepID=A0A9N9Q8S5_9HELO|nr:hypothetical protein HYALB_00013441 [Hymenoscyphus albidus]
MAPLRAFLRQSLTQHQHRTFTASSTLLARHTKLPRDDEVPPYPYGASQWYKQSNGGLYGMAKIRYGNIVSKKNEIKTRRRWLPNVQMRRLFSPSLNSMIRIRVTPRVLRTIDKCGGLDEYLLGEKPRRIKELGVGGWKLRWMIMHTPMVMDRFRRERVKLGLPPVKFTEAEEAERVRVLKKIKAELDRDRNYDFGEARLVTASSSKGDEVSEDEGFMDAKQRGASNSA